MPLELLSDSVLSQALDKPRRTKTKTSSAKTLLNKNIKVNTKIVFGEDGEVGGFKISIFDLLVRAVHLLNYINHFSWCFSP